jgi:hypothetical protein
MRDLEVPALTKRPRLDDVITMIDVAYYCDLSIYAGHIILCYNFSPSGLSGDLSGEGTYRFVDRNTVAFTLSGGTEYLHKFTPTNMSSTQLVKGRYTYYYDVVNVPCGLERFITCYVPNYRVRTSMLRHLKLEPCHYTYPITDCPKGIARVVKNNSTAKVCLLPSTNMESIEISMKDYDVATTVKYFLGESFKLSNLRSELPTLTSHTIWSLFQCLDGKIDPDNLPEVQFYGRPSVDEKLPNARAVSAPITTATVYAPFKSKANDEWTVEDRVIKPSNQTEPDETMSKYADEFVNLFIRHRKFTPLTFDEVVEHQKSPTQRLRNGRAMLGSLISLDNKVKPFQKNELYNKPSAPRNISSNSTNQTLNLSRYSHSFKKLLLDEHFYMPNRSPTEICEAVMLYAAEKDSLIETDYSRFDGSISPFLRTLERRILLGSVNPEYREDLLQILNGDSNQKCRTEHGVKYNSGASRLSGSAFTTETNTLVNAFVDYVSNRNFGTGPKASYRNIGPKYGDDGVTDGRLDIEQASKSLGLVLKPVSVARGQPLTFLSRVFINPWATSTTMHEPKKLLTKLTYSTSSLPDKEAYLNKVVGFGITDAHTPIFRSHYRHSYDPDHVIRDLDREAYYKARVGPWPQDPADTDLMFEVMAKRLGVSVHELEEADGDVSKVLYLQNDHSVSLSGDIVNHDLIYLDGIDFVSDQDSSESCWTRHQSSTTERSGYPSGCSQGPSGPTSVDDESIECGQASATETSAPRSVQAPPEEGGGSVRQRAAETTKARQPPRQPLGTIPQTQRTTTSTEDDNKSATIYSDERTQSGLGAVAKQIPPEAQPQLNTETLYSEDSWETPKDTRSPSKRAKQDRYEATKGAGPPTKPTRTRRLPRRGRDVCGGSNIAL